MLYTLEYLQESDNVLVSHTRHNGYFSSHLLDLPRLKLILINDLNGNLIPCEPMGCKGNFTKGPLTYHTCDTVEPQICLEIEVFFLRVFKMVFNLLYQDLFCALRLWLILDVSVCW